MKKTNRQVLVRGNTIYFYGELARKVEQAIKLSKLSPNKWLMLALRNYVREKR